MAAFNPSKIIKNSFSRREKDTSGVYVSIEDMLNLRLVCKDLTLEANKKSTALLDGVSKTSFRGRGMDFAEVRRYQAGDDIRNIDWRVTARTQKPYTKLFQEERERPVFILVDQRSPMFFGSHTQFKSVLTAELAAAIGWIALQNNDRIGALIFSDNNKSDARARRGKHAQLALLNLLNEYNRKLSSPIAINMQFSLKEMLNDLRRVAKPGSSIFIISDFHDYNKECAEPLSIISRHTDITLLHVYDQLEKVLPYAKSLTISDGTQKTNLEAATQKFSSEYKDSFSQIVSHILEDANKLGIQFGSLNSSESAKDIVIDLFSTHKSKGKSLSLGGAKHGR